ncbi:MAG: hypothetical protein AAF908_11765 [Pseudomonadota bacterium]
MTFEAAFSIAGHYLALAFLGLMLCGAGAVIRQAIRDRRARRQRRGGE